MIRVVRRCLAASLLATPAFAQKLMLELRPHAGDTLRMQLEQVTEMGSAHGGALTTMTTTMRMFSRAIVESTAPIAALILAVTDSVNVSGSDVSARALGEQARRELEGRQMRLRLWPDGTVTLNDGARSVPREVSDLVNVMPASFPSRPVSVGETWVREMPIPAGEQLGIPGGSSVRARFRLDSASAGGDVAWVSMSGTLQPAPSAANGDLDGSIKGTLVVDRKRGWLSESRFLLQLRSAVIKKLGAKDDTTRYTIRVNQTMQVLRPPVYGRQH